MTWQHDPRVKAVIGDIVAHTPDIGEAPTEPTIYPTKRRRRRSPAVVAVATVAVTVIGLAALIAIRAGSGEHPEGAITTPPANGAGAVATTASGVTASEPSTAATAATAVTSTTEAAPTTTLAATTVATAPATSTTVVQAQFESLRPGHVTATWLPPGYTRSDGPTGTDSSVQQFTLTGPSHPTDDIFVKVEHDTTSRVDRPNSAVDVHVRGGTGWVNDSVLKPTTMFVYRDAQSVWLIMYAPPHSSPDTLVRIADGLTN
jgi:hypothetical protein